MEKKVTVISALVEGCSVRSTSRLTGVAKGTILRLLEEVGRACSDYEDRTIRNLSTKRVQVDEIWSYCYAKEKNATPDVKERVEYAGDVWTFTAIEADSKLIISWLVGRRDAGCAAEFLQDVAGRLANRIQLTTDGHKMYLRAVPDAFGDEIDFAQLVKIYGDDPEAETRYSPARCLGAETKVVSGVPDVEYVSTSYIERQNLNMRMNMRRSSGLRLPLAKNSLITSP